MAGLRFFSKKVKQKNEVFLSLVKTVCCMVGKNKEKVFGSVVLARECREITLFL